MNENIHYPVTQDNYKIDVFTTIISIIGFISSLVFLLEVL